MKGLAPLNSGQVDLGIGTMGRPSGEHPFMDRQTGTLWKENMMLMRSAILVAGLAISACVPPATSLIESAGSVQANNVGIEGTREFIHFAGGKDLYTEIHGNPFPMSDEEFGNFVTGILNLRNSKVPTNFTTHPGENSDPAFRAVVVFNAAEYYNGAILCNGPHNIKAYADPLPGRRIGIDFAFCNGRTELHSVTGTLPSANGPRDHEFQDSLALTLALAQPSID